MDVKGRDEFTVELGWSKLGRLPELPRRPSGTPSSDRKEFDCEEFVFRISDLIPDHDGHWWFIRDYRTEKVPDRPSIDHPVEDDQLITSREAVAVLEPLVEDCIDKIATYGLPYFEELTAYWQSRQSTEKR